LILAAVPFFCAATLSPPAARADGAEAAPSPAAVDKAQRLFKKGAALYAKKKYALALEQFRGSYAIVRSPNSRLYVARCLADLGSPVDAYLEFDTTADEAAARAQTEERYAKTQQTALLERDELGRKLGLLTVTLAHADAAASLEIAGHEVPRSRWGKAFPVRPGSAAVVLRTRAGSSVTRTVPLSAGEAKTISLDAAPSAATEMPVATTPEEAPPELSAGASASHRRLRPYAYASAGIGLAGFAVFTAAGLMASSTYSDLSNTCGGPCPPGRQDDVDAGKTQKSIANVGLVLGAVGIAAGTTLFILSLSDGSKHDEPTASREFVVSPAFTGVRGKF
jgi:tetratricopeptide (TPR) repeat protein